MWVGPCRTEFHPRWRDASPERPACIRLCAGKPVSPLAARRHLGAAPSPAPYKLGSPTAAVCADRRPPRGHPPCAPHLQARSCPCTGATPRCAARGPRTGSRSAALLAPTSAALAHSSHACAADGPPTPPPALPGHPGFRRMDSSPSAATRLFFFFCSWCLGSS